jgi:peptidoglycan/xylan/chitin deacetylase (PgdA/CDA1 family)
LLTFDDGPSIRQPFNSTLSILDQLATNDVQSAIKAIFFVQAGHPRGGGTPQGRDVMRRIHEQGHTLAIHSVSPLGHIDHTKVPTNELVVSLHEAKDILKNVCGSAPLFIRPPFGACNPTTRAIYADLDLHMLMGDIRARDGIIYGYNGSLSRRIHIRYALRTISQAAVRRAVRADPITIVMEFHDVNPYTARHMTEYLHILVEEALRVGFDVPEGPFFNRQDLITKAAICRCVPPPPRRPEVMPGQQQTAAHLDSHYPVANSTGSGTCLGSVPQDGKSLPVFLHPGSPQLIPRNRPRLDAMGKAWRGVGGNTCTGENLVMSITPKRVQHYGCLCLR